MPHCIIEHSNEIDGSALIPLVHKGASESGLFQAEGSEVKVRAMSYFRLPEWQCRYPLYSRDA